MRNERTGEEQAVSELTKQQEVSKSMLTKQEEVLAKRLICQKGLPFLGDTAESNEEGSVIDTLAEAEFNRLSWEVVLITTINLSEEWDHIIVGLDDPNFDWASAHLPPGITYNDEDLNENEVDEDMFGNYIADRLTNEQLSLVVTKTIDLHVEDVELMHRLLVTLCNYDPRTCRDCFRQAIDISSPECGCLEGLLKDIEEHIEKCTE